MYPRTKTFFLEPTDQQRRYARCYSSGKCEHSGAGYHNAMILVDQIPIQRSGDGMICIPPLLGPDAPWPAHCACGYAFQCTERQTFNQEIYRRSDTGEMMTRQDAPPGAMWDAPWYPWKGSDGRSLVVKLPNGHEWMIDGRASNCTRTDDDVHRCWVRHGDPPNITVDKIGDTCDAGAGSILADDYHGFLIAGEFTEG